MRDELSVHSANSVALLGGLNGKAV